MTWVSNLLIYNILDKNVFCGFLNKSRNLFESAPYLFSVSITGLLIEILTFRSFLNVLFFDFTNSISMFIKIIWNTIMKYNKLTFILFQWFRGTPWCKTRRGRGFRSRTRPHFYGNVSKNRCQCGGSIHQYRTRDLWQDSRGSFWH